MGAPLVEAVPEALARFQQAGRVVISGPFDIQIARCAVVADPWGNQLILLDISKGAPADRCSGERGWPTGLLSGRRRRPAQRPAAIATIGGRGR